MNRSESIKTISAALVKAQKLMGSASKGSSNPFFKSKYADLNAVREACIPVLNEAGISVLQPTTVSDGKAYVETMLLHESGEFLSSLTEIIANKQNDAQAHGSGVSYARRYGLQSFLCIGAEDDDGEKAHGRGGSNSKPSIPKVDIKVENAVGAVTAEMKIPNNTVAEPAPAKTGFGVVKNKPTEVKAETKPTTADAWE